MAAEAEAKQLDSVTDVVKGEAQLSILCHSHRVYVSHIIISHSQEAEIDTAKAQEAIGLITAKKVNDHKAAALAAVTISKEDVALIVSELEVSEEVAERVLREVSLETKGGNVVEAALRALIY